MSFKENLLAKIEIERLAQSIHRFIDPTDATKRIDRSLLAQLIDHFPWQHRKARDLDLYLEGPAEEKGRILVLDNDLTIYHTTLDDVTLRKSPTVKEMLNIRNAIKILNDKDVVVSKKRDAVATIEAICVGELDLAWTPSDLAAIAADGSAALENGYGDGVAESLLLLADLAGMQAAPKGFSLRHHEIFGKLEPAADGETRFGPPVIFSRVHNTLAWLDEALSSRDKERFDRMAAAAEDGSGALATGAAVLDLMVERILAGDSAAKASPDPQA